MQHFIIKLLLGNYLTLFVVIAAIAQQPTFRNIEEEDGLATSTIYDVLQDDRGYIWLGTEIGLLQYDGNSFKEYPHPQGKKRSLTDLQTDGLGQIWMNDFYGQLYYLKAGKLFTFHAQNAGMEAMHIQEYLITNNILWIPNESGIIAYHIKTNNFKQHPFPNNESFRIVDILQRKNGQLYLLTDEGRIWKVTGENLAQIAQIKLTNEEEEYRFFETKSGELYCFDVLTTSSQFIYKYQENGKLQALPINYQTRITGIYEDNLHQLWVTTFRGIWGYTKTFAPLNLPMPILPDKIVSNLSQDFEGSYWVSTLHSGVFFIPTMNMLLHNQATGNFPDNRISSLAKGPENTLFIGFNNGKIVKYQDRKIKQTYQTPNKLEINELLYDESSQVLWACSDNLYAFNEVDTYPFFKGIGGSVKDIAKVNETGFFTGTSNYTYYFSNHSSKDHELWANEHGIVNNTSQNILIPIRKKRCRAVLNNKFIPDQVWVAHADGLFYLNPKMNEILDETGNPILAITLAQSEDSTLWVGTNGDGLYAIKNQKVLHHFDVGDGLISNFVKKIALVNEGLWLVGEKGIQQFNPQQRVFHQINQYDGLTSNEITDIEIINSTAWIATPKGLNEYNLQQNITDTIPPKLHISQFSIWEKDTSILPNYELPYNQNNLKITLNGFSYRSGPNLNYQYRLKGLEENWISTSFTNNTIRYPSLPPGNYQFEAKVANAKGLTSRNLATLAIHLKPPFWQTPLFLILLFSFLAALIYAILSTIIKNIRKKEQTEKALRGSQLAAIKAQMNPHFLFNAINSIQDFILLNNKRQANTYLGKFANLMRIILDMSNQDLVRFSDEVHALQLYLDLEALRFEDTLTYEFKTESIPQESIFIPPMLIQPHIENAIKHGLFHLTTERKLSIHCTLELETKQLKCVIADNGVGRKKAASFSQQSNGFGQKSTLNRLELLNTGKKRKIGQEVIDLVDSLGNPKGTKVILFIPYQ